MARSIRAKSRLLTNYQIVAAVADRGCRSQRLQLQFAAFKEDRSGAFHFIECAADVAGLKFNSAAAIDDDMRVQSEVPSIEHAVFDAIVQREAHKLGIFDRFATFPWQLKTSSASETQTKPGTPKLIKKRVILSEAKDLSLDAALRKLLNVRTASIVRFLAPLGMTN